MQSISLEGEQLDALVTLSQHIVSGDSTVHRFNGPGGTGKTTVLRSTNNFLNNQGIRVATVAYTGRAAKQLSKEGIIAQTCHSLLYNPKFDVHGNLDGWEKRSIQEIIAECGDGLVLDEASMLPYEMHEIFDSLPIPKIYAGDRAQLPSISGRDEPEFNAMVDVPGAVVTLTQNRRFSADSGIGALAAHLRETNSIPRMKRDDLSLIRKSLVYTLDFHRSQQFDVIICGMNKTRKAINRLVRKARGYTTDIPQVGETVVCLQNTVLKDQGRINNGELFTVEAVFPGKVTSKFMLRSEDGENLYSVNVKNTCWEDEKPDRKHGTLPIVPMTFGYCMSTHKCQGSTFQNVLFIDEDVSFFLDQQKFRYTAVTRAANTLMVAI